ncbi:hypothetical protein Droror1_Dr00017762 [Drosera rotundifolia]
MPSNLHTSNLIISKLLRTLTRLRFPFSHPYLQAIFNQLTSPNSFLWTSLIHGYSSNGQWAESLIAHKVLVMEFAKRGEMGFAREVFDGVVEGNKDVVAWRSPA